MRAQKRVVDILSYTNPRMCHSKRTRQITIPDNLQVWWTVTDNSEDDWLRSVASLVSLLTKLFMLVLSNMRVWRQFGEIVQTVIFIS